jgi:gliding motility-associated-like protein
VGGSTLQYQDKNILSKKSHEYYVRAFKNGSKIVSSSSNGSERFIMGTSSNPINTEIVQITNNANDKLELQIKRNTKSNYSTIDLFRSNSISSPVFVHTFSGVEEIYEDASVSNINTHNYYLLSKNMCGIVTDTSKVSNNIVLKLSENTDDLLLNWQKYFTWNNGVKDYTIYRSSGNTVSEASNFMAITSTATDTLLIDSKQTLAVACYYVVANESNGIGRSKSNTVCYIKTGKIYFPNAISINGSNKIFTFLGDGIDLLQSSIQIYNRWGGLEYNKDDISSGWDGRNNMGEILNGDVYFFTAQISQGKDKINLRGNITILR